MDLREAKLIQTKNNDRIFKIDTNDVDIYCWRDNKICRSNCAAWRLTGKVLNCMALPTDKRVAHIITEEE